jgi:hypothetical protein
MIISKVVLSSLTRQNFTSLDVSAGITVSLEAVGFPENIYNMNGVLLK